MRTLPTVVGHRGNSGESPANTLVSIEQAIRLGVDVVEVDVRLTRDGRAILLHDHTVDATTDGKGTVADMDFDAVRRLDAGAWKDERFRGERVPTLAEALELARGRCLMNLDIKCDAAVSPTVRAVRDAGMLREVVVSGCTEARARRVHSEEPSLTICLDWDDEFASLQKTDGRELIARGIERALRARLQGLNWHHSGVTPELVRAARMRGLAVWTWTVDEPERMAQLVEYGVDSITSNHPRRLLHLLGRGSGDDAA